MLQGTSSFLVPRDTPGLTIARCNETLGCRFMNNGEVVFEDMRVAADPRLVEHVAVELHGGNGMMLDFGVEKLLRDAAIFPHMDGTTDISKLKIVKAMFPHTAGKYAGPEV